VSEATLSGSSGYNNGNGNVALTGNFVFVETVFAQAHTLVRLAISANVALGGACTSASIGLVDVTSSTTLGTVTLSAGQHVNGTGVLSVAMPAGHLFALEVTAGTTGCGSVLADGDGFTAIAIYQ
jgi:hypothetical protein